MPRRVLREGMTPHDLTRIRFVGDPQLSPDGTRVAFVVTTLSEARDEYLSNIWVGDAAGGPPRPFTQGPKRDTSPCWSPDGRRLAFLSEREAKRKAQLYVMPADGGEAVRLTDLPQGVSAPVWAPDGNRLAVVARVGGVQEPEDEAERSEVPAGPRHRGAQVQGQRHGLCVRSAAPPLRRLRGGLKRPRRSSQSLLVRRFAACAVSEAQGQGLEVLRSPKSHRETRPGPQGPRRPRSRPPRIVPRSRRGRPSKSRTPDASCPGQRNLGYVPSEH